MNILLPGCGAIGQIRDCETLLGTVLTVTQEEDPTIDHFVRGVRGEGALVLNIFRSYGGEPLGDAAKPASPGES